MPPDALAAPARSAAPSAAVAVIDIGTSAVRMAVAEIDAEGGVRLLSTLTRPATLGKDTFGRGIIEKGTIEDCVRVLKGYRQVLAEHNIDRPEQIRCVATSAVREAQNRLAFIDRIYTATGIVVQPIDEGEVNRLTYLGVLPLLKSAPELVGKRTVVVEVGGGSTELLVVQDADVLFSHSYRLGSLRLREQLETFRTPQSSTRKIMELQIRRVIEQILQQVSAEATQELIGLGGDLRFAAKQLIPDWTPEQTVRLPIAKVERLAGTLLSLNDDKLVHRYHVSFADAATLGPALLAYVQLCQAFGLSDLVVSHVNLRDGLLNEMASRGILSEDFVHQVVRSAVDLGKRFDFDERHASHVAKLCRILFQSLREEHRLDPRYELLLTVAALLHEIGLYVSTGSYHKHTHYLITHSELFGLSRADIHLVALVARYHRRSSPKPSHAQFSALDREQRTAVAKLAALLRVAVALDASRAQRLHELRLSREGGRLIIAVPQADDLSLEQLALKQSGSLFEETYGTPVLLRQLRT
jgi:exopolyphosphatase/guanosine-5'-triphosphate,3'-diphosphate pyrophosphatase